MTIDTRDMKYIILHTNEEGLVLSQQVREQLFSIGTVLEIRECSTYSLKPEYLERWFRGAAGPLPHLPYVLILWNMEDRYNVAGREGWPFHEMHVAENYGDVSSLCAGLRKREPRGDEAKHWTVWDWPTEPKTVSYAQYQRLAADFARLRRLLTRYDQDWDLALENLIAEEAERGSES